MVAYVVFEATSDVATQSTCVQLICDLSTTFVATHLRLYCNSFAIHLQLPCDSFVTMSPLICNFFTTHVQFISDL